MIITGSEDITDEKIRALNDDYFNQKKHSSTNNNMKSVAYMLDTDIWNKFAKTGVADYAIGGPTIELLFKSYNQKYETQFVTEATSATGYQIKKQDSDAEWSNFISDLLKTEDSLYVITDTTNAYGMWLASPSASNSNQMMCVSYDVYGTSNYGFRPIVCLNSNVKLKKSADGNSFTITEDDGDSDNENPGGDVTTQDTLQKAITNGNILSETDNTKLTDKYGNQVIVPAGFRVTNDATDVTEGIVIEDKDGNQFVWVPVGEINGNNGVSHNIELNRYYFDANGTKQDIKYEGHTFQGKPTFDELTTSTYGNKTAKNLNGFKNSATTNHGYYIGRYEARTSTERTDKSDELTTVTEKGNDYVYNYVTQPQASQTSQSMYTSSKFTSDLMNSYAWDTAILFLQEFDNREDKNTPYSRQVSLTKSFLNKGTNSTETPDIICNIYDMASNVNEYTTETSFYNSDNTNFSYTYRGGDYNSWWTSTREYNENGRSTKRCSFRPILYLEGSYIEYQDGGSSGESGNPGGSTGGETDTKKKTVKDAIQSGGILSTTDNTVLEDEYGNELVVPKGFKVKNEATDVTKGIVIEDEQGNEFVWIPVGTIYTDAEKTVKNAKNIDLSRYTFDEEGQEIKQEDKPIKEDETDSTITYQELYESSLGNQAAKNINEFKASAKINKGYYIGRYEARTGTQRTSSNKDTLTKVTEKKDDYVYNDITQSDAANQCQLMYENNDNFTSDLINSYAWDTALVFLQEFDNRDKEIATPYSRQTSVNGDLAEKGTNNTQTPDEICNVYDMASNAKEWTTETEINESEEVDDEYPCVERGTDYCSNRYGECDTSYQNSSTGFRPILYINVDKSQIGEIERTVVIRKYRSGTRTGLQGAEIAIYKDDGSEVLDSSKKLTHSTTDKYGEVAFKLRPGKYKYREEKAPSSYVLNRNVYSFEVTQDGMIIFEEENYGIIYDSKLRFRVHVTDRSGNVIPGSRVQLYDSRGNKVEDSNGNPVIGTTDENGDVYFEDIEPGRYGFGYVEGSDGYTGDGTIYYVDVSEDGTTNYEGNSGGNIYTEEVKGTIKITKYRYGTSIGVQGAIIGIYNEDGSQVLDDNQQPLQLTTGENGEITFTLKPGKYKYKEIKSPRRYALNKTEYTFEVTKDGTVIFGEEKGILYNKKLGFWVHVKDSDGNGIPGSKVQLYDADGNIVTGEDGNPVIGTTDKDGNVFFEDIEQGRHGFGQVESDNGYTVDGTVHYVEIEEDGTVKYEDGLNGDIHTERVSGTIIIWKHRYGTNVGLQGAIIGIYNEDGTPVNQDGKHLTFETNEYGQIKFKLEAGKYKYKEEKAPSKYALNSTMYSFEVKEDGTIIFETDGGIIYDTKLRFGVHVKDRVGNGIPDFRVQLYDRNGDIVTDEDGNPVIGTTDENGDVYFEDIESGEYGYGQAEDNNGYIGDEEIHKVEVKEDGTVEYEDGAEGNIYFEVVMSEEGKYKIRKYIKDTTTPVEGAIIALYDEEGNPLKGENGEEIKLTTDVNGEVTIPSLRYGIYKYKEVEAPEGYKLNDTMYSFKVNSDGTITFEGETEGIIYNEKIKPDEGEGSGEQKEVIVIIKKYEAGTNIGLEGAVIGIYDENGKAVMREDGTPLKLTTDSNGQIQFKAKPGKYKYREERAPEGYELNATVYTFEVTEDGQVIFGMGTRGIIYNEKIDPDEGKDPDDEQKEIIVIIKKYEKGTNIGLEGAVIGLYYENGDALEDENGRPLKLTTDSNGIIEFKVKPGKYKYREERAPEGYKLNSTIYTFEVTEEGTIIFENDTEGIIYNEKNTDNPKPDDPQDGNRVDDNTVGGNVVGENEIGDNIVGDNEVGDNEIGDNEIGDNEIGDNIIGDNEVGDNEIGNNIIGDNEVGDNEIGDNIVGNNEITDNTTVGNNQTENNQMGDNSNGKPTTGTNKNNAVNSKNSINKIAPNGSTDKKQGSLPYTGIKRGLIVILFVINIICIYFGIKSTKE